MAVVLQRYLAQQRHKSAFALTAGQPSDTRDLYTRVVFAVMLRPQIQKLARHMYCHGASSISRKHQQRNDPQVGAL